MNVSPLDLRQQRFRKSIRGFDPVEVTAFLAAVADDYEQALRETDRLRQDLMRMEAVLAQHREHERNLQATMMTAQKLSDDIKGNADAERQRIVSAADAEAKRIMREAEGRSELLLEKTQARLEDIQREIDGLKLKRKDVETTIEASIQTLRNTLEFVREQEARERDERILLHRPRLVEQQIEFEPSADHPARKAIG
jgi:cell division initiation protein